MKSVFVVSPEYLTAIKKETDKYSFAIQGYGNFELAERGFIKINAKDFLGFIYAKDTITENDKLDVIDFIERLLLFDEIDFEVVIISKSKNKLAEIGNEFQGEAIKIKCVYDYDYLDDQMLKAIFADIIYYKEDPYEFKSKDKVKVLAPDRRYMLRHDYLFPKYTELLFKRVNIIRTLNDEGVNEPDIEMTMAYDESLLELKQDSVYSDLLALRVAYISAHFGIYKGIDNFLEEADDKMYPLLLIFKEEIEKALSTSNII